MILRSSLVFLLMAVSLPVQAADSSVPFAKIKPRIITEKSLKDTDDPAIWINPQDASKSLVIGTDKHVDGALYVYDLQGKIVQRVDGLKRPNNVDIASGFSLGGKSVDIAVATERNGNRLRVYTVPEMRCVDKGDLVVFDGDSKRAPMGIALYKRPRDGALFAFISGKSGPKEGYLGQYRLEDDQSGRVKMTLVREFGAFSGRGEIEAIAVDEELGYVYYSDEQFGIRKYHADPDAPDANRELTVFGTEGFKRDREGIAIYKTDKRTGYILVSDQQANQFRIFTREGVPGNPHDHQLIKIVEMETIATDGCEVTNVALSPLFPKGLFVAMSEGRVFHYYAWEDIAGKDLKIVAGQTQGTDSQPKESKHPSPF